MDFSRRHGKIRHQKWTQTKQSYHKLYIFIKYYHCTFGKLVSYMLKCEFSNLTQKVKVNEKPWYQNPICKCKYINEITGKVLHEFGSSIWIFGVSAIGQSNKKINWSKELNWTKK